MINMCWHSSWSLFFFSSYICTKHCIQIIHTHNSVQITFWNIWGIIALLIKEKKNSWKEHLPIGFVSNSPQSKWIACVWGEKWNSNFSHWCSSSKLTISVSHSDVSFFFFLIQSISWNFFRFCFLLLVCLHSCMSQYRIITLLLEYASCEFEKKTHLTCFNCVPTHTNNEQFSVTLPLFYIFVLINAFKTASSGSMVWCVVRGNFSSAYAMHDGFFHTPTCDVLPLLQMFHFAVRCARTEHGRFWIGSGFSAPQDVRNCLDF